MNNLYKNKIPDISKFPSYSEYGAYYIHPAANVQNYKARLINDFLIKFDEINNNTWYTNATPTINTWKLDESSCSYDVDNIRNFIDNNTYVCYISNAISITAPGSFQKGFLNDNINTDEYNSTLIIPYNHSNTTISYKTHTETELENLTLPIVGITDDSFDNYIYSLKYKLLQDVINKMTTPPAGCDIDKKFTNLGIRKYVPIAKATDELINNFIHNLINNASSTLKQKVINEVGGAKGDDDGDAKDGEEGTEEEKSSHVHESDSKDGETALKTLKLLTNVDSEFKFKLNKALKIIINKKNPYKLLYSGIVVEEEEPSKVEDDCGESCGSSKLEDETRVTSGAGVWAYPAARAGATRSSATSGDRPHDEEDEDGVILESVKENRIYDLDYNKEDEIKQQLCYKINPKVVSLLLNNRTNMNTRDKSGMTPLHYAIELQHVKVLCMLLKNNRVDLTSDNVKNNNGLTPFELSKYLYKDNLNFLLNSDESDTYYKNILDKMSKHLYENIKKTLQSKKEYGNNIIKYMDTGLKQQIVMLNTNFYFNMTYTTRDLDSMPFNKTANPIINIKGNAIDELYENSTALSSINYELSELKNKLKHLEVCQSNDTIEEQWKTYISNKINAINKKINELKNTKQNYINTRKNKFDNRKNNFNSTFSNFQPYIKKVCRSSSSSSPQLSTKYFKRIFNNVVNDIQSNTDNTEYKYTNNEDFESYNKLWDMYLKDESRLNNIQNIHMAMVNYEKELLDKSLKNTKINDYKKIYKLYKNTFCNFIQDYNELSQSDLSENYALDSVAHIIYHNVRHVLCSSLYIIILRTLTQYLSKISTTTQNAIDIMDQIKKMNFTTKTGATQYKLSNYIVGELPKLLVRYKLQVFENDYDSVKQITSSNELFERIITIIRESSLPITADEQIISNIRENIFPYFDDVSDLYIKGLKVTTDNYFRNIMNNRKHLKTHILLLQILKNQKLLNNST